ncbi:MAG: hypothetical protein ACP5II_03570 [Infirmifilum sp.]|uniref:hypothetical protein n=2 Tax=Infirmifilum TaxID=2856573 RepID=UPI003C78BA65
MMLAGFTDYQSREVDDKVWIIGSLIIAPLLLLEFLSETIQLVLYAVSIITILLVAILALKFKLVGEADIIALIFISFAEPPSLRNILTLVPPATIVILAGILSMGYIAYNVYYNWRNRATFPERTPLYLKIIAYMTMRMITSREYEEKRYMYTPANPLDPSFITKMNQSMETPTTEKFWAVVLLPYVTLLAIAFLIYIVLYYSYTFTFFSKG